MAQFADIECLRQATSLQTELVWREVRLAEDAIRRGRVVALVEDDADDPNALHVSRGRPTAIILPFARRAHRRG
jgi:hypothetical protein